MNPRLVYYSHRFRCPVPEQQWANVVRAATRFRQLHSERSHVRERLWAPWIELAEAGVPEDQAWAVIEAAIAASHGVLLDLDGADESDGMAREREIAIRLGKQVEELGRRT